MIDEENTETNETGEENTETNKADEGNTETNETAEEYNKNNEIANEKTETIETGDEYTKTNETDKKVKQKLKKTCRKILLLFQDLSICDDLVLKSPDNTKSELELVWELLNCVRYFLNKKL